MILRDKPQFFLPLGCSLLAVGLLLQRFAPDFPVLHFVTGMMMGMSVVFNIAGLFSIRKLRNKS
ncbi:MAG: hypothetical protein KKA42_11020 [candidate division Zixibacteria bacterium]|nr:hypothetical protein [candidate division Zixibacteria bacterium]